MKYDPSKQSLTMETAERKVNISFSVTPKETSICTDPATCGACSNGSGRFRIEASNRKEHRYEPGLLPLSCV